MDYACSRCSRRQAEDTRCESCGNDVVQDLRDSSTRDYLHRLDSERRRKHHARLISLAVVAAMLVNVGYTFARTGLPMVSISIVSIAVTFAIGAALVGAFERVFGFKAKYPYLADYEK